MNKSNTGYALKTLNTMIKNKHAANIFTNVLIVLYLKTTRIPNYIILVNKSVCIKYQTSVIKGMIL